LETLTFRFKGYIFDSFLDPREHPSDSRPDGLIVLGRHKSGLLLGQRGEIQNQMRIYRKSGRGQK
jgi:hypothetical protein